jgi:hypothetical protein
MTQEFIPYEQALALKELGFDEPCVGYYENDVLILCYDSKQDYELLLNCAAPLYQQAFRWFREKYDLFGCIDFHGCTPPHWFIRIDEISKNDYIFHSEDEDYKFNNYEEAELECLKKLIEIIKQK